MLVRFTIATWICVSSIIAWLLWPEPEADKRSLRLGSTTSTQDSGLLDYLLPIYELETGVQVLVIAKGTGAVIRDGLAGQVDALLVHNRKLEDNLVDQGYALNRLPIMSNNFLIVGSSEFRGYENLAGLLRVLASGQRGLFLSRGDNSGTHAAEIEMWSSFNYDPHNFSDWYSKTGTGMGQTLITANSNRSATLVDSATWARHGDKDKLRIWYSGHELPNDYGYLALNPNVISGVQNELATDFGNWLAGPTGQAAIGNYLIGDMQAFLPHKTP